MYIHILMCVYAYKCTDIKKHIYVCTYMHIDVHIYMHMYVYIATDNQLERIFLAISCPYSRAEHIPCQNSWEISGNCEDPFQVKFVFHTVCQVLLFFWHVRCRLHMFFPKEDPYFQQFLEMS